ncbi:MAG: hypothetical protein K8S97_17130 [Anaerolineae bacterium]|nr:hypothetical protein [Anaerolineae bacterium]
MFDNGDWDRDAISHFLDIPIPDEAQDLVIEGQMGLVGSYGIYPKLSFSFKAEPESALQFVEHFCNGELHAGYDPRNAIDLSQPAENVVLIRGKRTIHYSQSKNTPQTVRGNRCARYDDRDPGRRWIEEITLDTSDPDQYRVSYHLPFEANGGNAEEYYPRAQTVAPFGDQFRFNITGFTADHVLNYHTICMETTGLALVWDYFAFNPDVMPTYAGSEVTIFIDDVQQPSARISDMGLSLRPTHRDTPTDTWQYCLNANWEAGTHVMRVIVDPLDGERLVLNWEFTVPD